MRLFLWCVALLVLTACAGENVLELTYETVSGEEITPDSVLDSHDAVVFYYLSPECPLCQNYTVTMKKIMDDFAGQKIAFYGIVSGTFYPAEDVKGYLLRYELDLPIILDPDFKMAEKYGAEITPEAHLIDSKGRAVYRGAIDNWAISLGQKRLTITEHYLEDALGAYLSDQPINPRKTKAVGCYIE